MRHLDFLKAAVFSSSLAIVALACHSTTQAAIATISVVDSLDGHWDAFNVNTPTVSYTAGVVGTTFRTRVFDTTGTNIPYMKWLNVNTALAGLGTDHGPATLADVVSARLEITVQNFDTELGVHTWKLFGIKDGATNENFTSATTLNVMPGFLPSTTPVYSAQDPATSTLLGSMTLNLDAGGDPRPALGAIHSFSVPLSYLTSDTNGVISFAFPSTANSLVAPGDNGFRPNWYGTTQADVLVGGVLTNVKPRLVLDVNVPEPTSAALIGAVSLVLARRRK